MRSAGRTSTRIHRLDRGTSGALLFARSREAAAVLCKSFEEGRVDKAYLALVRGTPPAEGLIDYPIPKSEDGPRVPARTRFRLVVALARRSLLARASDARDGATPPDSPAPEAPEPPAHRRRHLWFGRHQPAIPCTIQPSSTRPACVQPGLRAPRDGCSRRGARARSRGPRIGARAARASTEVEDEVDLPSPPPASEATA